MSSRSVTSGDCLESQAIRHAAQYTYGVHGGMPLFEFRQVKGVTASLGSSASLHDRVSAAACSGYHKTSTLVLTVVLTS